MDVLLSELLREALAECTHSVFPRRERARQDIPTRRRGRTGEDQRAAFAGCIEIVLLERSDRLSGESCACEDVTFERLAHLRLGRLEERLPDAESNVEERGANWHTGPLCADGCENGLETSVVVGVDWEDVDLQI